MNLSEKPCYPAPYQAYENHKDGGWYIECADGLTFRERLIIALASNPEIIKIIYNSPKELRDANGGANASVSILIIEQADAIIKEMEK